MIFLPISVTDWMIDQVAPQWHASALRGSPAVMGARVNEKPCKALCRTAKVKRGCITADHLPLDALCQLFSFVFHRDISAISITPVHVHVKMTDGGVFVPIPGV